MWFLGFIDELIVQQIAKYPPVPLSVLILKLN